MKNMKRIAAAFLLMAIVLLCGCKENAEVPEKVSLGIMEITDRAELEAYLEEKQLVEDRDYTITPELCNLYGQNLLDSMADIEIAFEGERILWINARFDVFLHEFSEDEMIDESVTEYSFTEAEKEQITKSFDALREQLECYYGCQLSKYDLVPILDLGGSSITDPEKAFYDGLVLREYSVRDSNGILWLLRCDAFNGIASAVLYKIVDEYGYENFIPIVDMTK
jgi:hypothetical protein